MLAPTVAAADSVLVRDARAAYFAANGFSDAAYKNRWATFKLGFLPLAFPNTPSRQRALPMHDLHHVATGYPTTFVGEAEIGAWEIAGGCGDHLAAWVLDAMGFGYGLLLAPVRTYRAFMRGRHSETLYAAGWSDDLLALPVRELRARLRLDQAATAPTTLRDLAAFAGWVAIVSSPVVAAAGLLAWALR